MLHNLISRWSILAGSAIAVGAFVAGNTLATHAGIDAKLITLASWSIALVCGYYLGRYFRYEGLDRQYALHWLLFLATWYAAHELLSSSLLLHSHFVRGLALNETAATVLLGLVFAVGLALLIAAGFTSRAEALKKAGGPS